PRAAGARGRAAARVSLPGQRLRCLAFGGTSGRANCGALRPDRSCHLGADRTSCVRGARAVARRRGTTYGLALGRTRLGSTWRNAGRKRAPGGTARVAALVRACRRWAVLPYLTAPRRCDS